MKLILATIIFIMTLLSMASAAPVVNDISVIPIRGVNMVQDPKLLALPAPTWVDCEVSAGSAIAHAIPTGARFMLISSTANMYINFNTTAAVPAGQKTDGTASFLNPGLVVVAGKTSVSVFAVTGTIMTFAFYK